MTRRPPPAPRPSSQRNGLAEQARRGMQSYAAGEVDAQVNRPRR
jgi:hypothetical protein